MKLWLATTLAAILLSLCSAYPYPFDITPDANMEQGEDTTPDMEANTEDYTPDVNIEQSLQDYTPDVNVEQYLQDYTPDVNIEQSLQDYTPDVNVEQYLQDYTRDVNAEQYLQDYTPDVNAEEYLQDYTPDVNTEEYLQDYTRDVNIEQYDAGAMDFPQVQGLSSTTCLEYLYIHAFTSGMKGAECKKQHEVEVRAAGQTRVIRLPSQRNDYKRRKGDLWKLSFKRHFKFTRCVTLKNFERIAIEAGSNDGWNIESIVTYVGVHGRFRELTRNLNAFRWIDGNGPVSRRHFMLHKVY